MSAVGPQLLLAQGLTYKASEFSVTLGVRASTPLCPRSSGVFPNPVYGVFFGYICFGPLECAAPWFFASARLLTELSGVILVAQSTLRQVLHGYNVSVRSYGIQRRSKLAAMGEGRTLAEQGFIAHQVNPLPLLWRKVIA
nr:uncharacterized protein LOC113829934 [Penaeus vannamei]